MPPAPAPFLVHLGNGTSVHRVIIAWLDGIRCFGQNINHFARNTPGAHRGSEIADH